MRVERPREPRGCRAIREAVPSCSALGEMERDDSLEPAFTHFLAGPSLGVRGPPRWGGSGSPPKASVARAPVGVQGRRAAMPTRTAVPRPRPVPLCVPTQVTAFFFLHGSFYSVFLIFVPVTDFYFFEVLYHLTVLPLSRRSERNVQPQALILQTRTWVEFT